MDIPNLPPHHSPPLQRPQAAEPESRFRIGARSTFDGSRPIDKTHSRIPVRSGPLSLTPRFSEVGPTHRSHLNCFNSLLRHSSHFSIAPSDHIHALTL